MEAGREVDGVTSMGVTAPSGRAAVPIHLLCDGLTCPNPGYGLPVVFDGTRFLPLPWVSRIGNHSTIYSAVDAALAHARQVGATHPTIDLFSNLVWGQIVGRHGVHRLSHRRDAVLHAAAGFAQVRWRLVAPPLSIAGRSVAVRGFRKAARRASTAAGVPQRMVAGNAVRPRTGIQPSGAVASISSAS